MTSHENLSAASAEFGKIATTQNNAAAAAMAIFLAIASAEAYGKELKELQTMKTLQIEQTPSGQYRYRIVSTLEDELHVDVDWQFGNRSKEDTILQAEDRFLGNAKYDIENF